jgi:hypothetical protein
MRKKYISLSTELAPEQRSRVLEITNLFERMAWSLHRFGALLRASSGFAGPLERGEGGSAPGEAPAGGTPALVTELAG